MGGQRIAPAGVKGLRRLFAGSFVNQRGPQYGSSLVIAETGSSMDKLDWSSPRHHSSNLGGENNRKLTSQLGTAHVVLYRRFSRSAVQLAKHSTPDTSGKKKRSAKTAAEIARQIAQTQMRPIVYECTECTAMCVTRIRKDPYDRGVSIVRCMDCRSVNLISDHLGLFNEPGSMQRFLSERGVDVRNGPELRYELTPEDLVLIRQQQQEVSTG